MNDLISRHDAIGLEYIVKNINGVDYVMLSEVQMKLRKLPSVKPKQGKWIDKSGGIEGAWNYCSVCGEQAIDLYDFCPNCGADMRGESDETN